MGPYVESKTNCIYVAVLKGSIFHCCCFGLRNVLAIVI